MPSNASTVDDDQIEEEDKESSIPDHEGGKTRRADAPVDGPDALVFYGNHFAKFADRFEEYP
ncbi:MAG: hypothetical protein ACLSH6_02720 [Limosilactobacillus pontis]